MSPDAWEMLERYSGDILELLKRFSEDAQIGTYQELLQVYLELKAFFLSFWGALGLESISSLV